MLLALNAKLDDDENFQQNLCFWISHDDYITNAQPIQPRTALPSWPWSCLPRLASTFNVTIMKMAMLRMVGMIVITMSTLRPLSFLLLYTNHHHYHHHQHKHHSSYTILPFYHLPVIPFYTTATITIINLITIIIQVTGAGRRRPSAAGVRSQQP